MIDADFALSSAFITSDPSVKGVPGTVANTTPYYHEDPIANMLIQSVSAAADQSLAMRKKGRNPALSQIGAPACA